jgi:hypothetical protein
MSVQHNQFSSSLILFFSGLFLVSCSSVIHITSPVNGDNAEPITSITANFTADFKPTEPWGVYLDGVFVSGFFPTPAPGVTSTAPISLNKMPSGGISQYTITTNATCGTFCSYPSETVAFNPPQLRYNATNGAPTANGVVPQFGINMVYVGVQYVRSVPITVRVAEVVNPPFTNTIPIISIGATSGSLQPPGTPVFVTIPAGDTRGQFFIKSATLGNYLLNFTAAGASPNEGSGKIVP